MDDRMRVIQKLASELQKSEAEVVNFLNNAPKKYKVFTIPKRTSGHRVIAQPSKELKSYQRIFLRFQNLPVHEAAMAYRQGLSIRDNAMMHKDSRYLLKLDLENFFNSITNQLFWKVWGGDFELPNDLDRYWLENLLFWCPSKRKGGKLILSIGAPSSPLISNFFMYGFDCIMSGWCSGRGIIYTRYADDLTFSTSEKGVLFSVPEFVSEQLSQLFGSAVRLNRKKTKFSSKAHNRHVTGLTLSNEGNISLGRDRKRYIKHLAHNFVLGKLEGESLLHFRGLLAFACHVEPSFINSLIKKHSIKVMSIFVEV